MQDKLIAALPCITLSQNENGPCPLLAICNVLILRGLMKIPPGNTNVSSTYLLDLLGTYLLEKNRTQEMSEGEKANLERNILDTMSIFPKLPTGLDVNVRFNRSVELRGGEEGREREERRERREGRWWGDRNSLEESFKFLTYACIFSATILAVFFFFFFFFFFLCALAVYYNEVLKITLYTSNNSSCDVHTW